MDEKTKLKNNVMSNVRAVLLSVKGTCPIRQVAGKTFFESGANYNLGEFLDFSANFL